MGKHMLILNKENTENIKFKKQKYLIEHTKKWYENLYFQKLLWITVLTNRNLRGPDYLTHVYTMRFIT